jgi:hypothetical protein
MSETPTIPPVIKETPTEVRAWVDETAGDVFELDQSAFQDIIDNVSPELCGYAIALLAAHGGH